MGRVVLRAGTWTGLRRCRWLVLAVVLGLAGLVVFLAWPSGRGLPPARARVYTAFSACLLTDSGGVSGPAAAPVWAGMEAASLKTSGKVSYLVVSGDDSVANAVFFVNTLVERRCDLVIGVGATEVEAVRRQAAGFPRVHFVVVGPGQDAAITTPSPSNVSIVERSSDAAVSSAVETLVTRAAGQVPVR